MGRHQNFKSMAILSDRTGYIYQLVLHSGGWCRCKQKLRWIYQAWQHKPHRLLLRTSQWSAYDNVWRHCDQRCYSQYREVPGGAWAYLTMASSCAALSHSWLVPWCWNQDEMFLCSVDSWILKICLLKNVMCHYDCKCIIDTQNSASWTLENTKPPRKHCDATMPAVNIWHSFRTSCQQSTRLPPTHPERQQRNPTFLGVAPGLSRQEHRKMCQGYSSRGARIRKFLLRRSAYFRQRNKGKIGNCSNACRHR